MKLKNTEKNESATPSSSIILLGVLKGYLNNPIWFLIQSKITFKKIRRGINLEFSEEFINTSGFMAWLYIRLREKIGQEKAFEIMRAGILTTGLAIQQANFRNVEKKRTFENLRKFQQKLNKEGITKQNKMEILEESDKKYEFKVTSCAFFELFSHLNVPELTSIMCSVDNAIFNSYLPEKIVFHRNGINHTIAAGHKYCEFVIENME
ncbi:MAG TPA: L-2-amino-thiazoline-4-carboxylic acid hydrolase [Tenuifilaceae bacterium]|nr:L-2-amino-thiazoline-4-carboxylic acid hydrolase [Tenuifilaceae bacterium]HPE17590.1 L-2-amino-thiazoline-4-carboxylic acid hydrolase [Tenuifilaceae bacterium]HPJ45948.1 L-2-amino-thiazoline-4-carboxylic acid hydrolase [Tenuifilaceae bacterium]HPQ34292.1 L-2-amino-thiazoline-4-carboxylic acid hydrolase [Tenuifilaceae bacterium]HRX69400.1 L-2-amino-thiazoline-4-carboxylic acid hydrolase [Tenuifilaceae bacterium]